MSVNRGSTVMKRMPAKLFAILSMCICLSSFVFAAQSAEEQLTLEEIMSLDLESNIATKTKLRISESPAIVTVVTAEEIKAMGARNISDVINTLPGMYFSLPGSGILGVMWADYMRGIYANQTLHPMIILMINGNNINDAAEDSWGALNAYGSAFLNFVERIEIIRGPGSVIYGGGAIAGVINIVTKKGPANEAVLTWGTNGLKRGFVKVTKSSGDSKINLMASLGDSYISDGSVATRATGTLERSENRSLYDFVSRQVVLDLSHKGFQLQNIFLWERMSSPITMLHMIADKDLQTRIEPFIILSSLKKSFLLENASLNSKIFYRKVAYSFPLLPLTPPNIPSPLWTAGIYGNAEFGTDAYSGQVEYMYIGMENQDIMLGYETSYEHAADALISYNPVDPNVFTSYVYVSSKKRNVNSLYAQDTLYNNSRDLSLNLGLRYDNYSDFINGTALSPRVAVVYKTAEDYVFKAIYGTAFRPPSFAETNVSPDYPAIKNDPDIRPETMKTFELALDCSPLARTNLRLNYYNNVVNDLIASVTSDDPTKTWNTNVSNQKSWGLESEVKYLLDTKSYVFANASYLGESKDIDTGLPAEFVPELLLNAGVNYAFTKNISAMTKGFYRSTLKQGYGDTRGDIDPVLLFSTSVNLTVKSYDVFVNIYNMFDQEWKDPSISSNNLIEPLQGYGRRFDVGLRYMF